MDSDVKEMGGTEEPARALFFELEFLATSGWAFLYDAVKTTLAEHDIDVTPPVFSQYFTTQSLPMALKRLGADRGVSSLSKNGVRAAIRAAYVEAIRNDDHKNKGLIALTHDLRTHGIALGALTCLDRDGVSELLGKLNLGSDDIHVMETEDHGKAFPTAQEWLKLAKQMEASTALCTVAATSAGACKSALCAGMRCFAVPNDLTAFQDFSGADYVIESLDIAAEKLVLKLVEAF